MLIEKNNKPKQTTTQQLKQQQQKQNKPKQTTTQQLKTQTTHRSPQISMLW